MSLFFFVFNEQTGTQVRNDRLTFIRRKLARFITLSKDDEHLQTSSIKIRKFENFDTSPPVFSAFRTASVDHCLQLLKTGQTILERAVHEAKRSPRESNNARQVEFGTRAKLKRKEEGGTAVYRLK